MEVEIDYDDDGTARGPLGKVSPSELSIVYKSGFELKFRAYALGELLSSYEEFLKTESQSDFKFSLQRFNNNTTQLETLIIDFSDVSTLFEVKSSRWRSEAIYGSPDFS